MKTAMLSTILRIFFSAAAFLTLTTSAFSARQLERLDRGLVAAKSDNNNAFLSWRLYATDPAGVQFNVYRNDEATPLNVSPLDAAHTSYTVTNGATNGNTTYSVATLVGSVEVERSKPVTVWTNQYLNIPVEKPVGYLARDKSVYTAYSIYDGSVGDLDGDGQYEIVFFWVPDNLQDNSNSGVTGNVFIDAYKLDGTKLWGAGKYIDLGANIRAGAHYQHFLVYDFDGDGKAEIIVKTAPGTTDTKGTMIGSNAYLGNSSGYVLAGPEYLSVFEGATGKLLDTKPYDPPRHPTKEDPSGSELNSIWGDDYGNRCDRYLAAVAFLDGVHPSAVMCRGYYTRTALCAWDWDGVSLNKRWLFDTRNMNATLQNQYGGQGDHSLSVGDVDGDGKDEIIYGAMTVNDDGTPLYSSRLGHGDALHVGKFDPNRDGLQIFGVYEAAKGSGEEVIGTTMRDARTGDVLWKVMATEDVGRGLTADIDPDVPGAEAWSSRSGGIWSAAGTKLSSSTSAVSMNMAIYWDGDVGRELLDGTSITKITASGSLSSRSYSSSSLITFSGASTNGGTKNNPCLQADILGDWREEVILRASNNTAIRVYTTVAPTVHTGAGAVPSQGIPTLMHNSAYRLAVAWQNVGYNQPPHTDFFLGYSMTEAPHDTENAAVITVTLNPNGGKFADNNTTATRTFTAIAGAYFPVPEVTKGEEDEFSGWFLADGSKYQPAAIYTKDITLTAMWSSYTLTFDANGEGATVSPSTKKVVFGTEVGNLPAPARKGYGFESWNSKPDGDGDTYISTTIYNLEANLKLYAQWKLTGGYTLTLNPNGGEVTPTEVPVVYGSLIGTLPVPVYEGYTFLSWNTRSDGKGSLYDETTTYNKEGNSEVYAKWIENLTYQLSFDANGGTLADDAPLEVVYDRAVGELPEPVREGYSFYRWNTRRDGNGVTYTSYTVYEADDNVKLYAQWRVKSYVLHLDANGGTPIDPDSLEVTYDAAVGSLPTPLREGEYEFVEWNAAQDGSGVKYEASTLYNVDGNLTLYAKWLENLTTYQLSFDANGGTLADDTPLEVAYNEAVGELPEPVRTGYSFYSWNTEREGNGATYTSSTVYEADGDVKLYAQWRAKRYTLRFNANGGTPVDPDSLEVTYDAAVGDLPTPLREGEYEFVEWNAAQDGSGVKYEASTLYKVDGNLTLYAQWLENLTTYHQLSFDANGGTLADNTPREVAYNEPVGELPEPVRTGYSFYSWNTEREGNGATYTSSTVYEADGDVKLYAQWRAKRYALRFNANGGTPVDPDSLGVTYDVAVGSLPTPLREGEYEFVEWNAAQDGSGVKYESSTLYSIDGNLTLYAQWKSTDEGNNNNNDDDDGGNNNNNNDDDDDEEEEDGNDDGGNNNDPTGVATAGSRQILKLYPNPITGGKLMIDSEQLKNLQGLKDKKLKVKIYTLSGSLVGEYAAVYGAKVTTINVGHLASGVYMVKVGDMVGRVVKK